MTGKHMLTETMQEPRSHVTRVIVLTCGSLAISAIGGLCAVNLLSGMSQSICDEMSAYLGEGRAYVYAHLWIAVSAGISFAALCLFTYAPSRAWRIAAVASGCWLLFVGALTVLYGGLLSACQ